MSTESAAMVAEPGDVGFEQILVKNLKGKTITLEVEENSTTEEVKTNIQQKEQIREDQQVLTHKGNHMEDDKNSTSTTSKKAT